MTSPSGERPPLRIGTKEREAAYAALNAHLEAGRLEPDEYGERYGQASIARTRPELEALFTDLPAPHPVFDPAPNAAPTWSTQPVGQPSRGHRPLAVLRLLPLLPIIAIVVAISTGFWFVFFLIPAAFMFLGGARHHRGYGRGYGRSRRYC